MGRGLEEGACETEGEVLGEEDGSALGASDGAPDGAVLGRWDGASEGIDDSDGAELGAGLRVGAGLDGDADGSRDLLSIFCSSVSSICRRLLPCRRRPLRLRCWFVSPRIRGGLAPLLLRLLVVVVILASCCRLDCLGEAAAVKEADAEAKEEDDMATVRAARTKARLRRSLRPDIEEKESSR